MKFRSLSSGSAVGGLVVAVAMLGIPGAIAPAAAVSLDHYLVSVSSSGPVAGSAVTITAQAQDAGNNNIAAAGLVVTWSQTGTGTGGSFSAPTSVTSGSGKATVKFTTAGFPTLPGEAYRVTATTDAVANDSPTFTTVLGTLSALRVTLVDSTVQAGETIEIDSVVGVDRYGNVVNPDMSGVTSFTIDKGTCFLDACRSTVAGTRKITGTSGTLKGSVTATVSAGVISQLVMQTQPKTVRLGLGGTAALTTVSVRVTDQYRNTVSSSVVDVTVALSPSPNSGVLGGSTTVATVNGVATFAGLTIDAAGKGYSLAFTSPTLFGVTSNRFDVNPAPIP